MKQLILIIIPMLLSLNVNYEIQKSAKLYKNDARKLTEYYRQRVLRGESMSSIAKLYSEDIGSAINGGLYNNIVRGMMVPEFDKVAFSLKPNEISEVFETQFGFHFIQLISRKGGTISFRHLLISRD